MENINLYVVVAQWLAIVVLAVWVFLLVNRGRRELVYTKEELNLTIRSLEMELIKLKKDVLKHSYKHEKTDKPDKTTINHNA
ncbi:MAG: hypothetical protein PHU27_11470 [Salinivirgaceae bacterium]|nr:hypothetical protein [Salinivirgaceae bacterium]MDD4747604.1 hypothetical protein [Salinivirgaceae bacterium]MDY0281169.1 hypothetical protein [Salinivirgaceae bacterium]